MNRLHFELALQFVFALFVRDQLHGGLPQCCLLFAHSAFCPASFHSFLARGHAFLQSWVQRSHGRAVCCYYLASVMQWAPEGSLTWRTFPHPEITAFWPENVGSTAFWPANVCSTWKIQRVGVFRVHSPGAHLHSLGMSWCLGDILEASGEVEWSGCSASEPPWQRVWPPRQARGLQRHILGLLSGSSRWHWGRRELSLFSTSFLLRQRWKLNYSKPNGEIPTRGHAGPALLSSCLVLCGRPTLSTK